MGKKKKGRGKRGLCTRRLFPSGNYLPIKPILETFVFIGYFYSLFFFPSSFSFGMDTQKSTPILSVLPSSYKERALATDDFRLDFNISRIC